MFKYLKNRIFALMFLFLASTAKAVIPTPCDGEFYNPISHTDWNNMFPITIMGAQLSPSKGNTVAPLMQTMPPICVCPTIFGIPLPGVGITYWQPLYISEIEHRPGCLSSLSGLKVLSGPYEALASNQTRNHKDSAKFANRMQVHWYEYPVFTFMKMFQNLTCKNPAGFNLAYVTELDPIWQDDLWSAIFSPETTLFANPFSHLACAVDAAAAIFTYPLDPLFWCAGSWGNIYPFSSFSSHSGDPFTLNNQIGAKFLARNARMGLSFQTIGPTAVCFSHPNPIWIKSQYRHNQIMPVNRRGRAVSTGDPGKLFQFPPITNTPTNEHTVNLIWQGQQCCLKPIP